MSQQVNECKECGCTDLSIVSEINPETCNPNMRVIATCDRCGHSDEYLETSHETKRRMKRGLRV